MPFEPFVRGDKAEKMRLAQDVVVRSLTAVKERCDKKKQRFDLNALLKDIFTSWPGA